VRSEISRGESPDSQGAGAPATPGGRRRYRSAIRSERAIETSFARLLREKPVHEIAVTDVVAAAGVARATFYAHFRSTDDLLHRIQAKVSGELSAVVSEVVRAEDFAGIRAAVGALSRALADDADFYRNLLGSAGSRAFLTDLRSQTFRRLVGLLAPAHDERRGRLEVDLMMLLAGIQAVMESRVLGESPSDAASADLRLAQHIMAFRSTYVGAVVGWDPSA
jgi:AcrR family transcriptional regulator